MRSAIPVEVKQVARGYIVKYRSDAQVNYIMQNSIYSQLQARNLTPDLTNDARYHRELLVPDVPESLYELQKEVLLSELEHQNNIKILQITPFSPQYSSRKYFKIILETCEAKENLISRGIIYLRNVRLHVGHSCPTPPDRTSTRQSRDNPPIQDVPVVPARDTSSNMQQSQRNHWGNLPAEQSSTSDGHSMNIRSLSNSSYPSETIYSFHAQSFKTICSYLCTGPINPEMFVFQYNLMLDHYGYPKISIPDNL